jgi:hypothetical protein
MLNQAGKGAKEIRRSLRKSIRRFCSIEMIQRLRVQNNRPEEINWASGCNRQHPHPFHFLERSISSGQHWSKNVASRFASSNAA